MTNRILKCEKKNKATLLKIRKGCYPHVGNNKELVLDIVHIKLDLRKSPRNTLHPLLFPGNSTVPGKLLENT